MLMKYFLKNYNANIYIIILYNMDIIKILESNQQLLLYQDLDGCSLLMYLCGSPCYVRSNNFIFLKLISNIRKCNIDDRIIIAKYMLEKKININSTMVTGESSLMIAIYYYPEIAKFLIETSDNIDINIKNYKGWTALTVSINKLDYDIIELLINKGINLNCQDNDGLTPFMHLLRQINNSSAIKIIDLLIENDINYDIVDNKGRTILMHYFMNSLDNIDVQLTVILIKKSNLNVRDYKNNTSYDYYYTYCCNIDETLGMILKGEIKINTVKSARKN